MSLSTCWNVPCCYWCVRCSWEMGNSYSVHNINWKMFHETEINAWEVQVNQCSLKFSSCSILKSKKFQLWQLTAWQLLTQVSKLRYESDLISFYPKHKKVTFQNQFKLNGNCSKTPNKAWKSSAHLVHILDSVEM